MIEQAILIGLASWRMASLIIDEAGPFHIFERIRELVGVKEGRIEGFFPELFSCVMCISVWTTIFCYLIWLIEPMAVMLIAAMSIALVVDRIRSG